MPVFFVVLNLQRTLPITAQFRRTDDYQSRLAGLDAVWNKCAGYCGVCASEQDYPKCLFTWSSSVGSSRLLFFAVLRGRNSKTYLTFFSLPPTHPQV